VPTPKLIAHRGYALRNPENTLASVEAAIAAGARFVEIDVQLSRDHAPFLMHDRTLERMCGVPRALGELTAREIGALRASEGGRFGGAFADEPVASLASFVATIARSVGVHAFVEIKRAALEVHGIDAVLDAVLPAVEPIAERCTLISFDGAVLQAARLRSRLPVGPVLIDWRQLESAELRALRPEVIFCDVEKLPASGPLRALDVPLAVYEVDDPRVALELAERGVELVETFQIAEMLRALDPR
jgi:glycerophosphoryl diester phosphodiesterase